jgi:hypothetical protein
VKVVATPACDRQELQRHIQIEFAKGLGQDIVVDVRFVDTIERTAGGKHRCLISMLPGRPLPVFESEAGNATSM